MGDNVSVEDKTNFQDKLQFVQQMDDRNFGDVTVHRFKEPPYQYIMNFQKTFIEGDTRVQAYYTQLQQLQQKQHKNLAKIHLCLKKQQNHMCIKDTKIQTYANYYNFTLQQAIEKKKMREGKFTESELAFVLSCLLDVGGYLKKEGIIFGDFRPEQIFLTPEGYIKIYLLDIQDSNRHTSYYKALVERSLVDEYILAPEQLAMIERMEYEPKNDVYKSEIFTIGMVLMELITLDKTKFYYNEDRSALKMGRINFDLTSLGQEYSQNFLDILRGCLMEDPSQRLSLEEASYQIENLRKNSSAASYCLRLHDEEESNKKTKPSISTKGQYILSGIEKRLTPSPITTLTSSTSSGFHNKNSLPLDQAQNRTSK